MHRRHALREARAETQTNPPPARTSRARARSPTRWAGGSSPDPARTPRLGRSAMRVGSPYQATASAVSRASSSSASRQTTGRASSSCNAASTSGSAGSETRAATGKSARNARKGSLEASSWTRPESADVDGSMRLAGTASREVMVSAARGRMDPSDSSGSRGQSVAATDRTCPNHPQGHPRCPTSTLSENPCPVGNDTVEKPCRLGALRFGQLKRCCVTSRPSVSSVSTASAARATIASRSSCASNGVST